LNGRTESTDAGLARFRLNLRQTEHRLETEPNLGFGLKSGQT
jgi:hypothetical protein